MKTFLGFTTGVFVGAIAYVILLEYMYEDDPEYVKNLLQFN